MATTLIWQVGSDVLGIAIVLAAAVSLLDAKPKFAAVPCTNKEWPPLSFMAGA